MRGVIAAPLCLLLLAVRVGAETALLDDSRSPRQQLSTSFDWVVSRVGLNPDGDEVFRMRAVVTGVEYRLDSARFEGRRARIFLLFPRDTPGLAFGGEAQLSWRTRGVFSAGAVTQGERALVFEGLVDTPLLTETFDFTIEVDVRDLSGPFRLSPRFELETE